MKKIIFTLALIFGLTFMSMAEEQDGGLFRRGPKSETEMADANGPKAPLGSGIAVLLGLGGCYALGKMKKQD